MLVDVALGRTHLDTSRMTASHLNASNRPLPAALSCSRAVSCGVRKVGYDDLDAYESAVCEPCEA